MKTTFKILLSLFLFLGAAASSHGQAAIFALIFGDKVANENFYLRIDAGASFTSLPGLSGAESRTAFYYGLGTYIKINERWSLSPEFKPLSARGASNIPAIIDYSGTLTDVTYQANMNYMDVPFLVTYSLPPTSKVNSLTFLPTQFTFLVNCWSPNWVDKWFWIDLSGFQNLTGLIPNDCPQKNRTLLGPVKHKFK